jgi:hypothetical protein
MGAKRQFRSAGPMLVPNCTEAELCQLRQAVETSPKIKFLALYPGKKGGVMILAQAREKLSLVKWRESIHPRLQSICPVVCMRSALRDARRQQGFEEFGRFSKTLAPRQEIQAVQASLEPQPAPTPAPEPCTTTTTRMREIMLRARESFLQTLAVFFQPPDQPMTVGGLVIRTSC